MTKSSHHQAKRQAAPRLLQLPLEIEPPHVLQAREGLPEWVASGGIQACRMCPPWAQAMMSIGLSLDGRYTARCPVHDPGQSEWFLGLAGSATQVAIHGPVYERAAHVRVQEQERAYADDQQWFDEHPNRRFRARPPRTWRELAGSSIATPGSQVYALIERDAPAYSRPWVSRVSLPFSLESPPPDMPASVIDALILKIIEDEQSAGDGEVLEFDDADLERDQEASRSAHHAAELTLAAAHRKGGAA